MCVKHVLVIDADPDTSDMWTYILKEAGYAYKCVSEPKDVRKELKSQKYDVVILDVERTTMHFVASIALVRTMKVYVPPIVLLSALHPHNARFVAQQVQAVADFQKPAQLGALLLTIQDILHP